MAIEFFNVSIDDFYLALDHHRQEYTSTPTGAYPFAVEFRAGPEKELVGIIDSVGGYRLNGDIFNKQSFGEDPVTCPLCGSRTEWEASEEYEDSSTQVHTCPSCLYVFASEEGDES